MSVALCIFQNAARLTHKHTHTAGHKEQKLLLSPLKELTTWKQQNRKRVQTKTGILFPNDEEWGWRRRRSHETRSQMNEWMNGWIVLMYLTWNIISSDFSELFYCTRTRKHSVCSIWWQEEGNKNALCWLYVVRSFTSRSGTFTNFYHETELLSLCSILPME